MNAPIVVAVVVTLLMLGFGGATTRVGQSYRDLRKPPWNPPDWLFGPAWTVILGLAAWAGVLAWTHARSADEHLRIGVLFAVNIVLHTLWSPLFFNLRRVDWALIEACFLWLSIAALIAGLTPISALAGLLLSPYLLWVTFAVVLNFAIVRLNPRPSRDVIR
jgi:tryptophan-rich sensory protein